MRSKNTGFIKAAAAIFAATACSACNGTPEEAIPGMNPVSIVRPAAVAGQPGQTTLAGFSHQLNTSRFAIGTSIQQKNEFGMDKQVGSRGTFSIRRTTGMVIASSNATSPYRFRPPFADAQSHNEATRSYFVGAGLPAEQIQAVKPEAIMTSVVKKADWDPSRPATPKLDHFATIIRRQVGGFLVHESYATAWINVDGDVVTESVYWPTLPSSVASDAQALSALVNDPVQKQWLVSKFPADAPPEAEGHVVIHHTVGSWDGGFSAIATYDVGIHNRDRHFGIDGAEIVLPEEAPQAWGNRPSSPKPAPGLAP